MQQEDVILEKLENHDKRLDDHDKRITKNEDDISDIKVTSATQDATIKTLNKSMERLTDTINK
ncbi:hypothetical protein [Clostridium arbusti]|uniref:hypothetical protein n=1 Tax=Clostridium arbusti TaxID=1137848 RepID=UPI0002FCBE53|nr:hypothetical protein [Clostridium arbusti]